MTGRQDSPGDARDSGLQSFDDFEILLVDDGADAYTRAVLHSFNDPRIRHIRQSNDGLSAARNRGLAAARGDYVCFLDADDSRPNWALQTITDEIDRSDPDVVFCAGVLSEVRGELTPFYDRKYFDHLADIYAPEAAALSGPALRMVPPLAQLIEPQSARADRNET